MAINTLVLAIAGLFFTPTWPTAWPFAELTMQQPASTPGESPDCGDLQIMERLARIAGPEDLAKTVAAQRTVTCTLGGKIGNWPNGKTIKLSQNTWNYPTGTRAKISNSTWNYPDGGRAKISATTWNYPDGTRARLSEATWKRPGGSNSSRDALVTWACSRIPATCEARTADIKATTGDQNTLAIIEMAWLARLDVK